MTDHEIWQTVGRAVFLAVGIVALLLATQRRKR